jgi:drug/metabolite transporter (DMT)-like permease
MSIAGAPLAPIAAPPTPGRARAALLLLTAIWGSTFVVIDGALEVVSPFVLVATRFALASAVLAAVRPAAARSLPRLLVPALPLGISTIAGFGLQTVGLESTTPTRSAFVTALMVVFVPGIEWARTRRAPGLLALAAVAVATGGVFVLFHPVELQWRHGDTLTLLSAIAFAYYVVELSRLARLYDAAALVLAQTVTIAALAVPCIFAFDGVPRLVPGALALSAIAYLALVCTAFTFVVMTRAQAVVPPVEASVIYTLEPVLAAALSALVGREALGWQVTAGGALVLVATLLASLPAAAAPGTSPPS